MKTARESTYTITGGPLEPHEYIIVKREMTAGDEAWIQNHATQMSGSKKNPEVQLTIGDIKLATLKRMITAWSLTIEDTATGEQMPIPLSEQAIEDLPRQVAAYINRVIAELNPDEEEDSDAFTNAANGHSGGSSKKMSKGLLKD